MRLVMLVREGGFDAGWLERQEAPRLEFLAAALLRYLNDRAKAGASTGRRDEWT